MRRIGPILWPLLLIVIGILFLLSNLGLLAADVWATLVKLWPLILVVIGLDILIETAWRRGRSTVQPVSIEQGTLSQAEVSVEFGAGELRLSAGTAPGKLLEGEFSDDADYRLNGERLRLFSHPYSWNWWGWGSRRVWNARLTRDIPLQLRFQLGACQADLDLSELDVGDLSVESGAADTRVRLPAAAGMTHASIKTGAASTRVNVPEGVGARITATMAIGTLDIDGRRFPRSGSEYLSPDYATAANKIDLHIEGGVGEVRVS